MNCQWKELLAILPPRFRDRVDRLGRKEADNIRLRLDDAPEICCRGKSYRLEGPVTRDELHFTVNAASRYSPWAAQTLARGYLTAPGGHRIGVCGEAVMKNGEITGIREISSLCIRVARDFPGISGRLGEVQGSVLILGAPGWGKTTLLRDLIRCKSDRGVRVAAVDERQELFPPGFARGRCTDVLSLCPKTAGLDILLRTMGPEIIALDEITAEEDCRALRQAAWCGVSVMATVHAASLEELRRREVFTPVLRANIFDTYVILHRDQTWHTERSMEWDTKALGRC